MDGTQPPLTAPQADLGLLAHRVSRGTRHRLAARLGPLGITPQQAAVILRIAVTDPPCTIGGIADALAIDRPTMTGIIARLDRDGWIRLDAHCTDRRAKAVGLTDRAHAVLPDLRAASAAVSDAALQCLGPDEAAVLTSLLARVADHLEDGVPHTWAR